MVNTPAFDVTDLEDDLTLAQSENLPPLDLEEYLQHLRFFDEHLMGCLTNTERPWAPDKRPEREIRAMAVTRDIGPCITRAGATRVL
jgi:hypothetical protein